jgi:site-specific DNA-methyltransferase (adenine-specific)
MIELLHEDNMKLMARYPDKYFDLAIVDPPYGIDADKKNSGRKLQCKKSSALSKNYGSQEWDSEIPNEDYFNELMRVSKKQIVWGANFFGLKGGYLYWHKNVTMPTYSTGELAWLSWLNKLDYVEITWHGMIQHDMQNKEIRVHPTQKPVQLYRWLLDRYAKPNDKILDTHLGSGSIAIACHDMGFDLVACEIDKDYYNAAVKRFNEQTKQLKLIA